MAAQSSLPPPGVSGRKVTGVVLTLLVLVGVAVSYPLWTYGRLDQARQASAEAWRELTTHLAERYRRVEKTIAAGVDGETVPMELGEQFRLSIERFRTGALTPHQHRAAAEIEALLASEPLQGLDVETLEVAPATRRSVERYNALIVEEQRIRDSAGGRILAVFLNLPRPNELQLTAPEQDSPGT